MLVHTCATTHCMQSGLILIKQRHILLHVYPMIRDAYFADAVAHCTKADTVITHTSVGVPLISLKMRWKRDDDAEEHSISYVGPATQHRISTHLIVRLQRRWRYALECCRVRKLAFCMGGHPRLGAMSPVQLLPMEALCLIGW